MRQPSADNWQPIRGDGSEQVLPLGTRFDARERGGRIECSCLITKFCLGFGFDFFRHNGSRFDIVAIRVHP